mmetsp:Transcript_20311/g.42620  ORF Transcript_20311/g.42620 Transcript_20311/m.42620 type:complete len:198 (-) Transcript_20311:7-600(-)
MCLEPLSRICAVDDDCNAICYGGLYDGLGCVDTLYSSDCNAPVTAKSDGMCRGGSRDGEGCTASDGNEFSGCPDFGLCIFDSDEDVSGICWANCTNSKIGYCNLVSKGTCVVTSHGTCNGHRISTGQRHLDASSSFHISQASSMTTPASIPALTVVGNDGSPSNSFPLGNCEGDCDNNDECEVSNIEKKTAMHPFYC